MLGCRLCLYVLFCLIKSHGAFVDCVGVGILSVARPCVCCAFIRILPCVHIVIVWCSYSSRVFERRGLFGLHISRMDTLCRVFVSISLCFVSFRACCMLRVTTSVCFTKHKRYTLQRRRASWKKHTRSRFSKQEQGIARHEQCVVTLLLFFFWFWFCFFFFHMYIITLL